MIENNKIDKDNLSALCFAISDLFNNYNMEHGSIKKFKVGNTLVIIASTGGWSDNKVVIRQFNGTQFHGAPIRQWFLTQQTQDYFRWDIPLYLISKLDSKVVSETSKKILRCGFCGLEIITCDYCKKEFKEKSCVICLIGEKHFCSKECLKGFLKEQAILTEVFLDYG